MKELGYYYSKDLKTVIIGFRDEKGRLNGRVIGHTIPTPMWGHAFSVGYTYNAWAEGFFLVARLLAFSGNLKEYLEFLNGASVEQIEAYFEIKKIVLERHLSCIQKREIDGRTIKYILHKKAA